MFWYHPECRRWLWCNDLLYGVIFPVPMESGVWGVEVRVVLPRTSDCCFVLFTFSLSDSCHYGLRHAHINHFIVWLYSLLGLGQEQGMVSPCVPYTAAVSRDSTI